MTLPDTTLAGMAASIGPLPPGDVPAAWFMSQNPEVLARYDEYITERTNWNEHMVQLLQYSKLPWNVQYVTLAGGCLHGLVPPEGARAVPRWWRRDGAVWVPRKRTRAEKASEVNKLWATLVQVPQPRLPGLPDTLWLGEVAYAPIVRKPGNAVLVFLAHAPEQASQPFEVGHEWTRLKVSTFHLLIERQRAAAAVLE